MLVLNSAELANWKSAARVALQVFDVGSGAGARFFQRLHRAVAVFAAHQLASLGEGFVEGAWQPTAPYFDFALRHDWRFLLSSHRLVRCSRMSARSSPFISISDADTISELQHYNRNSWQTTSRVLGSDRQPA